MIKLQLLASRGSSVAVLGISLPLSAENLSDCCASQESCMLVVL